MRSLAFRASLTSVVLAAGLLHAGCYDTAEDCALNPILQCGPWAPDAGPSASCDPSKNSVAIADSCGVFVSPSGDDANAGTKERPVKTIGAALGKRAAIYACAGTTAFNEMLTVTAGATIYGGLDCSSWSYVGATTKTIVTAGAGQVPVTLAMGTGTRLVDLHVLAADVSTMSDGTSSIAVVANGATAELDGCVIEAQGAAVGAPGTGYTSAAQAGMMGLPGADACTASITLPGNSVSSGCGTPDSTSGLGGIGAMTSGGNGSNGQPGTTANGGTGEGSAVCTPGTVGDAGMTGASGVGATALGSVAGGTYAGAAGADGMPGTLGQGGGGGGGAMGGTGASQCTMASTAGGASGGSGGSGGCGGTGGNGGKPGGSSIALVDLGATLTMSNVTIKAGNGGNGGAGGLGQNGGAGGMPGPGGTVPNGVNLHAGCQGGPGGSGGNGGQGGGGRGGHAIGIGYTGATAPSTKNVTFVKGTAGAGGTGDDSNGNMGSGAAGVAVNVQGF